MLLTLLVFGLVAPAVASANPLTGSIYLDSGPQWWFVVTAAIVLIEWPIFALTAEYNWAWSFVIVALANAGSGLLGAVHPVMSPLLIVPGYLAELLLVMLLVFGLRLFRVRAPSVFLPVLLMNVATFWIAPALSMKLPPGDDASQCLSREKRIAVALDAYAKQHDGTMPRVHSMQELRAALAESLEEERSYHCPGREGLQLVPWVTDETGYILLLPWPAKWAEGQAPHRRALLVCPRPVHQAGYICLYADGHAKWLSQSRFQSVLTDKNHIEPQWCSR